MLLRSAQFAILLVLADIARASISNGTKEDVNNKLDNDATNKKEDVKETNNNLDEEAINKKLVVKAATRKLDVDAINKKLDEGDIKLGKGVETRRQRRKSHRSTSSSSGEKEASGGKSGDSGESLGISTESSTSSEEKKKDGTKKKKDHKPKSSAERTGWKKWHRKCTPCPEEMTLKWRDPRIKWICGGYQRARRSFKSLCMMHFRNCQDGTMFTKIFDHRCPADVPGNDRPHGDHFFYDYAVHLPGDSSASSKDTSEASSDSSIFF